MSAKFEQCPLCGAETLAGFVQSRDGLGWSRKKRLVAALSGALAEVELGDVVVARNCPNCKAIYIDYAEEH